MENLVNRAILFVTAILLSIAPLHCQSYSQSDSSWSSLPSIEFDDYYYGEANGFPDLSCSSCICLPSADLMEMDIFCFVIDIQSNWFTNPNTVFHLPGQFKYLSVFETRDHANVAIDLPANAFRRFQNDTLDKVHFHGVSFGITDSHAFSKFPLKYLLLDSTTMWYGDQSFATLFTAINALRKTLMELHVVEILTLDDLTPTVELPPMDGFTALTTVVFGKIPFKSIRPNTFNNLRSLKYLSFKDCPISYVSADAFTNVPALTVLQIAASQLTSLPKFVYSKHLVNLEVLSLRDAFISDMENFKFLETFATNGLRFLDIRNNGIKEINPYAVANLNSSLTRNLEALYLWDNQFHCDCDLFPFVEWLQSVKNKIDVRFESPQTKIEEVFARDAHCIPRAHCTDINKESRENSIPQCSSPKGKDGMSLLTMDRMTCKQIGPKVSAMTMADLKLSNSNLKLRDVIILSIAACMIFSLLIVLLVVPALNCTRIASIFKDQPFQYDVYLSHHNKIARLVNKKIIPLLETHPNNFKVKCRDLQVGTDMKALNEAFSRSRATLFLIDGGFVSSNMCMLELNVACSRLLDDKLKTNEKQNGIILFFLDSTSLAVSPETLTRLGDKIAYIYWNDGANKGNKGKNEQWRNLETALHTMNGSDRKTEQVFHVEV